MGLFDSLKETVKNNIQNAVEEEVSKTVEEKGKEFIESKKEATVDYLEKAKEREEVTPEGKEAIDTLLSAMDNTEKAVTESTSVDGDSTQYEQAALNDLQKLADMGEKNNNNNLQ